MRRDWSQRMAARAKAARRREQDMPPDLMKRQLAWHLWNCANCPPGPLDAVVLRQARQLLGLPDDEDEVIDLTGLSELALDLYALDPARRRRGVRRALAAFAKAPLGNETVERNVEYAREEFGLDETETEILLLLLRYEHNPELEEFADAVLGKLRNPARAVAALIGADAKDIANRIGLQGGLTRCGILCRQDENPHAGLAGECGAVRLAPPLRKAMYGPFSCRSAWANALFGAPAAASLAWEDFAHLGAVREFAANMLGGAVRAGAIGVNVLIYGPVGTGKTEFCKTLAARLKAGIFSVGEADGNGGEPVRHERLASLRLAQRLLSKRPHSLILFDEAEDLLDGPTPWARLFAGRSREGSKVHVNRLLEENPVPVLWTCNAIDGLDPAVLRRMMPVIEIKTPTRDVRARIWRREVARSNAPIDAAAIERLATLYEAPPGVVSNAVRAVLLAGGGPAEVETALQGVLRPLGIAPLALEATAAEFDPELTNCNHDLKDLVAKLARPGARRDWSLCIQGPPGTGKSQFARHVAATLQLEVVQKRASDLLSPWVGVSEKQIAAAFAGARQEGAMLVIDEADSLLSDRRGATHSWEVTQVNEMLTWMESHPLPFLCTTNLMERLDEASLRRFTLKLRFEPLTDKQAALAFERFFQATAPRRLPEGLAPGDFATVLRKRTLFAADASTLVDWLTEEAEAKGRRPNPIGFRV